MKNKKKKCFPFVAKEVFDTIELGNFQQTYLYEEKKICRQLRPENLSNREFKKFKNITKL